MANTVHGPFTAINVVNGSTPANATWGNNAQTQASIALNGLNGDVWSSFILSGCTPTKDGTLANQLDIASGIAYLRMNDNSVARCDVAATTFTTSTPSTTYYLDLNPDGSWSWGTAHSGVPNHQLIAQCTTDGSGNISVVTDNRGPGGMPGVPYVVAAPAELHVTSTTLQNPLWSFQPSVPGLYRISGSLYKSSGGTSYVYARTSYWGVHSGASALSTFFITSSGVAAQPYSLQGNIAGGTTQLADGEYGLVGSSFYASTAGVIAVSYQDASGTPNDYLLLALERLR